MIADSVAFLKAEGGEVIYDAEHFFDGFRDNPEYALATLDGRGARPAPTASCSATPTAACSRRARRARPAVRRHCRTRALGIHAHNDAEMAVANTLAAVAAGATRCRARSTATASAAATPTSARSSRPSSSSSACSCVPAGEPARGCRALALRLRAGEHAALEAPAVRRRLGVRAQGRRARERRPAGTPLTYEHMRPEAVGNRQRVLVSDYSGSANVLHKAAAFGIDLKSKDPKALAILAQLKELEDRGFQFEGAEASFELLMKRILGLEQRFFELKGTRVIVEKRKEREEAISEATVKLVVDGKIEHTAAEGNGPVNALDSALRKALLPLLPDAAARWSWSTTRCASSPPRPAPPPRCAC